MRKSGLHKQISSIFDGVSIPQNEPSQQQDLQASGAAESGVRETGSAPVSETVPVSQPGRPALARRLSADPADCPQTPVIPIMRPAPLPKKKFTPAKSKPDMTKHLRKTIFGGTGTISPHQKKMTALVGILSIVFGVVMFVSLGGVGKSQAATAGQNEEDGAVTQKPLSKVTPESWILPEPVTATIRDATRPLTIREEAAIVEDPGDVQNPQGSDPQETQQEPELVVRGIVFSKTRPTAIINDKVYGVGELVSGVKVVDIARDNVTFQADEKTWTQVVQR